MSLRSRLFAGAVLIAVVLAVAAVVVTRSTEAKLVSKIDDQLRGARQTARGMGHDDRHGPGGGRARQLSSFYVGYVADGRVTTWTAPNLTAADVALPALDVAEVEAAAASGRPYTVTAEGSSSRYRVLAAPGAPGDGTLVVALPLDDVDAAVARLVTVQAVATTLILALLAAVSWWVVHLGVRPLKRMTTTATAIADGDLSARVPEAAMGTEAGELGVALNRMLGRIEDAFAERARSEHRLRQFIGDASHELRTPITTIRGYAELYRTGALDDPDELGEAMRRTEQEAVRMGTLVDDLLLLARLDQGRPLEHGPVDLVAVADDAVRDARAVDPNRPIDARHDGALVVDGDEGRLRQVVANVVANALVHTSPGTPIDVVVHRDGARAVLEVTDRGPGMAPDVAAQAFERFYRADESRSRHRGGSGLGLSIVAATVGAHGGDVSLRTRPGEGTTVRIELPVRP